MPEYTLKIRRFNPEFGETAYWEDFEVDLPPERSVLDGILKVRDEKDGSIGIRCSCQAAICGSCGVKINGRSALACNTKLSDAAADAARLARGGGAGDRDGSGSAASSGAVGPGSALSTGGGATTPAGGPATRNGDGRPAIVVEPMGNMPVLKDLIVDMDAVHWKKVQRVVPWLLPEGDPPEREYIVPAESMIDVTQAMACIQCGACVSACLSLEVDPEFIGPAALAKAYRFVGDPRDSHTEQRLRDLSEDPHGIYDCTHCFQCVEVCPKDVAPMDQIMRLRRRATADFDIKDSNNGYGHEHAFVNIIERYGTLHEAQLIPRSYGDGSLIKGQTRPSAVRELIGQLPTALRGLMSGKGTPRKVLTHPKLPDQKQVRRIFEEVESKEERLELNLYIVGEEGAEEQAAPAERRPES